MQCTHSYSTNLGGSLFGFVTPSEVGGQMVTNTQGHRVTEEKVMLM